MVRSPPSSRRSSPRRRVKKPSGHVRFPAAVQLHALTRQKFRCASCGTGITALGRKGQATHKFGEHAEGHHIIPHKIGGPVTAENCVVLCRACHLNAHQGGMWNDASLYDDIAGLPMPQMIATIAALYPHYRG